MNTRIIFVLILVISGLAVFGITSDKQAPSALNNTTFTAEGQVLQTQTATLGAVTVKATPLQVESGQPVIIELVLDTHSVELDFEMTDIVLLTDSLGNIYQPFEWTGDQGGHHLQGELVFESVLASVGELTLSINGIENESANMTWNL